MNQGIVAARDVVLESVKDVMAHEDSFPRADYDVNVRQFFSHFLRKRGKVENLLFLRYFDEIMAKKAKHKPIVAVPHYQYNDAIYEDDDFNNTLGEIAANLITRYKSHHFVVPHPYISHVEFHMGLDVTSHAKFVKRSVDIKDAEVVIKGIPDVNADVWSANSGFTSEVLISVCVGNEYTSVAEDLGIVLPNPITVKLPYRSSITSRFVAVFPYGFPRYGSEENPVHTTNAVCSNYLVIENLAQTIISDYRKLRKVSRTCREHEIMELFGGFPGMYLVKNNMIHQVNPFMWEVENISFVASRLDSLKHNSSPYPTHHN